jgi:hypothetical protein
MHMNSQWREAGGPRVCIQTCLYLHFEPDIQNTVYGCIVYVIRDLYDEFAPDWCRIAVLDGVGVGVGGGGWELLKGCVCGAQKRTLYIRDQRDL